MGYVAVSGGEQAIAASLELLERERVAGGRTLDPALIIEAMPHAVEQVQSEGSVWAPEVAAIALKQASGSIEEAVFFGTCLPLHPRAPLHIARDRYG